MQKSRLINIRAVDVDEQVRQGIMRVDTQLDNLHFFGGICMPFEVTRNGSEQIVYGEAFFYGDSRLLMKMLLRTHEDGFIRERTPERDSERDHYKIYRIPLRDFPYGPNKRTLLETVLEQNRRELPIFLPRLTPVDLSTLTPHQASALRLRFRSFPQYLEDAAFAKRRYYRFVRD